MKKLIASLVFLIGLPAFSVLARDIPFPPLSEYELDSKNMIRYAFLRCSASNTFVSARLLEHLDNVSEDTEMVAALNSFLKRADMFQVFALKIHTDANPLMEHEVATQYINSTVEDLVVKYADDYNETKLIAGDGANSKAFIDNQYCTELLDILEG